MAENIEQKIKSYRTAPFDARFPNTNQTRNCFQNYLGEDMFIVSSWIPPVSRFNMIVQQCCKSQ